jgi:hypothetical protein
MYTISDFFCLKVQGVFSEKFFSSSFTVVLSSECLHALDLGLGGSLWHVCFGSAEVGHRIVLIGLLF